MALKLSAFILISGLCVALALPVTVKKPPAPAKEEEAVGKPDDAVSMRASEACHLYSK